MITTLMAHDIVKARIKRNRSNGSHWITLKLTDKDGGECEISMFHNGSLRIVDSDVIPALQSESGSALPRPGSEADSMVWRNPAPDAAAPSSPTESRTYTIGSRPGSEASA